VKKPVPVESIAHDTTGSHLAGRSKILKSSRALAGEDSSSCRGDFRDAYSNGLHSELRHAKFLISERLQQERDCRTDPLNPEFHKEFSSLSDSGELARAVPPGRVFLLLVFVGEPTCSGTGSVCRRGPSGNPRKSCRGVVCYCLAISALGKRRRTSPPANRVLRDESNSKLVPQRKANRTYFFPGQAYR
jgi:hypothetical protein